MLADLNKLMVYAGMFAAKHDKSYLQANMDPGWADAVHTTITGQHVGDQPVFHTNFHYFLAAALLELLCIALIAPT